MHQHHIQCWRACFLIFWPYRESRSLSCQVWNAVCLVIVLFLTSGLVFWIFLLSILGMVPSKSAQVLIHFIRFMLLILALRSFLVRLRSSSSCLAASTDIPDPLLSLPLSFTPQAGLQGYIPYPHIAAVCMFELVVLLLLGPMWGSIGIHHLWARPCFSSSVLCV